MTRLTPKGFLIAAPSSGQGKTLVSFGLLKALRDKGLNVQPFKTGPDYIDPKFHERAAAATCYNLDPWAMSPDRLHSIYNLNPQADLCLVEGVMGLFDGAEATGQNTSSAALATQLGLPVVLVVDCKGMAQSLAALVHGFKSYRPDLNLAGLILNRVASPKHERMLRADVDVPVLGCLPRVEGLQLESRHLGLTQASELDDLDGLIDRAGDWISQHLDLDALIQLADGNSQSTTSKLIPPLGQRIAVAQDVAFGFAYPHVLEGWRAGGAELSFFSPLENQAPDANSDAVYLPGGYPELYAERLSANTAFLQGLKDAADRQAWVYGECGGFMVLGSGLIDKFGKKHKMADLLPVETSFQTPKRQLGYRQITSLTDTPFGPVGQKFRGHEFHFSSVISQDAPNLFAAKTAADEDLGVVGLSHGKVFGSYMHLIDMAG